MKHDVAIAWIVRPELQDSVLASDHYPVSLTVVPKLGSASLFRACFFNKTLADRVESGGNNLFNGIPRQT